MKKNLGRLPKGKKKKKEREREKTQVNNDRNERRDITTDITEKRGLKKLLMNNYTQMNWTT